jgi:hypothetical protein
LKIEQKFIGHLIYLELVMEYEKREINAIQKMFLMRKVQMKIKCLIGILILFAVSCKESNLKLIKRAAYPNLKEKRLGSSSYYVKLPSNIFIEEARGKEGQLGYGFWQIDSAKRYESYSGFIEVEHGKPIGSSSDVDNVIEKVRSNLLDEFVQWKIGRTETGYFEAVADHGKLKLSASSPTRAGIDSMMSIISTLSVR